MIEPAHQLAKTYAEYLAFESSSETKHEFLNGEVYAMAGGTPEHARLAANMIRELGVALRGRPCAVFSSDVRVRVLATGLATYPDVTVACGQMKHDPEDKNAIVNPAVLVEVLSDSTEGYDRAEKFAHYRRIQSLTDYVLVSHRDHRLEHYRRNDDGTWTLRDVRSAESVRLASIECDISVDDVYRNPLEAPK